MKITDIFKRSNEVAEVKSCPDEPSTITAQSIIFRDWALDGAATSLSTFFGAAELISNSIAQLPILVKRNNEVDDNHPINFVFKNSLVSKYNFIKMLVIDMIMHGNGYAYIKRANDGTPLSLIYCEHGTVTINYNQTKQELYYHIPFIRKGKIEPIDVIHLQKNSYDGITGKSIISYANQVIKLAKASDKAAYKYYSSGCALQGALMLKGSRKNSKEQAREAFIQAHGEGGSGLVILDDDMSYTPISSNANESQMLEARNFNVTEIARFFNINPILLGESTGYNASSIEAANLEFVSHTLMPYIALIEDEFNRKLVKPSEHNIRIDLDETYLIKADKDKTAIYLKTLTGAGILSVNEARKQLGLAPIEGGDDHTIPYTKINDNKIDDQSK